MISKAKLQVSIMSKQSFDEHQSGEDRHDRQTRRINKMVNVTLDRSSRVDLKRLICFSCLITTILLVHAIDNVQAQPYGLVDHKQAPTSSPLVTAAAAAALGGLDLTGSSIKIQTTINVPSKQVSTTSIPRLQVQVIKSNQQISTSGKTTGSIGSSSSSTASRQELIASSSMEHKHSSKKIALDDKLHKFDLYIDPVCEQINKLTDKQINRVYAQLKQFSQLVSSQIETYV